jgi:hypothetical protein
MLANFSTDIKQLCMYINRLLGGGDNSVTEAIPSFGILRSETGFRVLPVTKTGKKQNNIFT